jgi:IS30 family transposase
MRLGVPVASRITAYAVCCCLGGGIAPAARRRADRVLSLEEREDISRGIASGSSIHAIASGLGRAASTVSREVTRHGGRSTYRALDADKQAWKSALRAKRCLLAVNRKLREAVADKLVLDWSPEQISGWLKTQYPDDKSMRVSHETIYRSLFIQARSVLKQEMMEHLRSKRSAGSPAARSSTPSRSVKGPRKRSIERSPGTGKAIC